MILIILVDNDLDNLKGLLAKSLLKKLRSEVSNLLITTKPRSTYSRNQKACRCEAYRPKLKNGSKMKFVNFFLLLSCYRLPPSQPPLVLLHWIIITRLSWPSDRLGSPRLGQTWQRTTLSSFGFTRFIYRALYNSSTLIKDIMMMKELKNCYFHNDNKGSDDFLDA